MKINSYLCKTIKVKNNFDMETTMLNTALANNLIQSDSDDNKFVDCCITANAQYIVSNDRHFDILKQIDFPHVNVISAKEFSERLTL